MDKSSATIQDPKTHKMLIPRRFATKIFLAPDTPSFSGIKGRPTKSVIVKRRRNAMKSSNTHGPQISGNDILRSFHFTSIRARNTHERRSFKANFTTQS